MKGHIRKRGNSYAIVVELPRDPATGKRRQQWHYVKGTKRDAERALRNILTSMDNGSYIKPKRSTLGALLTQWLADYVTMRTTPRTLESYSSIVNRHLIPALGAIPLTELQPQHIQSYYARALEKGRADNKGGLSARNRRSYPTTCSQGNNGNLVTGRGVEVSGCSEGIELLCVFRNFALFGVKKR